MKRIDPRQMVNRNLGKFLDLDGNRVEAPKADATMAIVAGPWERMPKGAMQGSCQVCKRLVGFDPRSQAMLEQPGKVHYVFCRECWEGFQYYKNKDAEGMSRWLDQTERRIQAQRRTR
jgi:hypothetical protein